MKVVLLAMLLCLPALAFCQDGIGNLYGVKWLANGKGGNNSDSSHHTDTTHYHFTFAATGIINNANSIKSYILNNALKFSIVKKSAAINFNSSWVYGKQSHVLTNNDFTSSLDIGLYETLRHFYYWGLANYTTNFSLQIIEQGQAGVGVGYNLVDKKKAVLILSDGLLYERDDLYDSLYGGPEGSTYQHDEYGTVRNSFRLLYHWNISDIVVLDGTGFIQNSLAHSGDYILKLNASISVKLKKWLSVTSTAQYNQFTRTRSRNDIITFGLMIVR
jgi:hypothetical protein